MIGLATLLARYAQRFHAHVGAGHHVVSPLGAWLLLAMCSSASSGRARDELTDVLGTDVESAAAIAGSVLGSPHPVIASAAGVWTRPGLVSDAFSKWLAGVPAVVETAELQSQAQLDTWANEHTVGLIDRFPIDLSPETLVLLATALATRVSWDQPFDVVAATKLGAASPWADELHRVLRTPGGYGHQQFIASTERAGDVAVHTAHARDGLLVTSVAATPEVPAADVLSVAYELATAGAVGGTVDRRSLFDLPLGHTALWTVSEDTTRTTAPDGREERCSALLPAWSKTSNHDLLHSDLGFPAAGAAIGDLLGLVDAPYEAVQSVMARYSRVGFEAAAVTAMAVPTGVPIMRDGVVREAELRFGHPFAVIAVATDERFDRDTSTWVQGPWHGLPVFSAWVVDPDEADEAGEPDNADEDTPPLAQAPPR